MINCVLRFRGKILVVQRSRALNFYPDSWNGISGFLDDARTLEEKARDELREELGIASRHIKRIRLGEIFHQDAPKYKKTWIVHPVLVDVASDTIKLDWEAKRYRWLAPKAALKLKLMPGFNRVLTALFVV